MIYLKRFWKIIINSFLIFIISGILHFGYSLFPNCITSLFFPVNESIWEHNKIIIGAYLIWGLITMLIFRKNKKNIIFSTSISAIFCSILVMLIFTPVYFWILNTKDNIIVTFIIFLIAIIISQILNQYLLSSTYKPKLEKIGFIIYLIVILFNIYLTYNPIKIPIFFDYNKNIYGIAKNK